MAPKDRKRKVGYLYLFGAWRRRSKEIEIRLDAEKIRRALSAQGGADRIGIGWLKFDCDTAVYGQKGLKRSARSL